MKCDIYYIKSSTQSSYIYEHELNLKTINLQTWATSGHLATSQNTLATATANYSKHPAIMTASFAQASATHISLRQSLFLNTITQETSPLPPTHCYWI